MIARDPIASIPPLAPRRVGRFHQPGLCRAASPVRPLCRLTVALFGAVCAAQAATLNVPSGTYPTIASAIAAAAPGDEIVVANNTTSYTESVVINGANGTAASPITLRAATRGQVSFTGTPGTSGAKLEISRAYWIVDGFVFKDMITSTRATTVRFKGATNSILRHCKFYNVGTSSTSNSDRGNTHVTHMTEGSSSNIIERCWFEKIHALGLQIVNDGTNIQNRNNVFRYNYLTGEIGIPGSTDYMHAVRIGEGTDAAANNPTNTLVEKNLWENVQAGMPGVYVKCGNNTVQHNTFRNTPEGVSIRRGPGTSVVGNYFFDSGGIRVRATDHIITHNYFEGGVGVASSETGIRVMAGQLPLNGNTGHVAAGNCTIGNNTIVDLGADAFTYGADWQKDPNTGDLDCKKVAPSGNTFSRNLFVSRNGGQALLRYQNTGTLCDGSQPALCPDTGNTWAENVTWAESPGTLGYTRSGITSNINPVLTRDTFNNWVGSVTIAGVSGADYGAHPPYRPLNTADVGPNSTYVANAQANVKGNAVTIADGDASPSTTDHTDFGSADITSGTVTRVFTVENLGTETLTVGSVGISGTNAADFTVTVQPATSVAPGGSTTFSVRFDPSATGARTASLSFATNDEDKNPYNFSIQGTGTGGAPEINITGNTVPISDGDPSPSTSDHTDFGAVDATTTGSVSRTFTIQNLGTVALSVGAITFTGANPSDFSVTTAPAASVAGGGSTTFVVRFLPTGTGTRTATINIVNGDANENPYNFAIQGSNAIVGWWKMNQTSGTNVPDSSVNNFAGSLIAGGWQSSAVSFAGGTNDYVSVPFNAALAPANFTVSLWAKANQLETSSQALFMSANGDGFNKGFALLVNTSGQPLLRWGTGTVPGSSITGANSATTTWRHIVATFDGTTMRLYVNGVLESSSGSVTFGYGGSGVQKIGDSNGVTNYDGLIDDVRVFNRVLTAAEIGTGAGSLYANNRQ